MTQLSGVQTKRGHPRNNYILVLPKVGLADHHSKVNKEARWWKGKLDLFQRLTTGGGWSSVQRLNPQPLMISEQELL